MHLYPAFINSWHLPSLSLQDLFEDDEDDDDDDDDDEFNSATVGTEPEIKTQTRITYVLVILEVQKSSASFCKWLTPLKTDIKGST